MLPTLEFETAQCTIARHFTRGIRDYWGVLIDQAHVDRYYTSSCRRFELLVRTISREAKPGSSVLEVGAAYGHTLLTLQRLGYDVCATDLPGSIGVYGGALDDAGIAIVPWDIHFEECPLDNSANVVVASEVLEHLQVSLSAAVRALSRPLKPGGSLIVTTPNICRLTNTVKILLGRNIEEAFADQACIREGVVVDNRCHPREPTMSELRSAFRENGFQITQEARFCPHHRRGLRRLAYAMLPHFEDHLLIVGKKPR